MRTLVIGLDAFDPNRFERLLNEGKMPHMAPYVEQGGYARLAVSNPPQTEVSWTSIATGLNPGSHGIFDFVHRDPATYTPYVSLLPTERKLGGVQFSPPFTARTMFEEVALHGYPATALWWPAMFPARPELPINVIPGLGTPDIRGRLGVGTCFCTDDGIGDDQIKTSVARLEWVSKDSYRGILEGPTKQARRGERMSVIDLRLDISDGTSAKFRLGDTVIDLVRGRWSPIIEVTFKLGLFVRIRAITRVILTQTSPDVQIYVMPLQIHPLHTPWRYGLPKSLMKRLWSRPGPFLTLGMPQDATALEDGFIDDDQFLRLCDGIFETRERILMDLLDDFQEGVLASVFDSLDRVQHMLRRDQPNLVDRWYVKIDGLIGRVANRLRNEDGKSTKLIILSDHGFSSYDKKVHLNRWLQAHGYLVQKDNASTYTLKSVNWTKTKAYALGLNSLYINLEGREGEGSVARGCYAEIVQRICAELTEWHDEGGKRVIQQAYPGHEVFTGSLVDYGPDVVVGYAPGYRASSETGLGHWKDTMLQPNCDHWSSDHCIDVQAVPGVLFCSEGLDDLSAPTYMDIPELVTGMVPIQNSSGGLKPPTTGGDDKTVEDRLKSLGYL
jgi:predicted AlkP superfamily phosphohydrolase/phosphomutase